MHRRLGALACIGFACWLAGCDGGGETSIAEGTLRDCLAKARFARQPPKANGAVGYAPVYLDTAPDFTAYSADGTTVDVVVLGDDGRAQRTAAHVRSALESLGSSEADASARVISRRNAVVVFSDPPSPADRGAVRNCLGAAG